MLTRIFFKELAQLQIIIKILITFLKNQFH